MIPPAPWRVVIVSRVLPVVLGFYDALRETGHEPVALLTVRDADGRYGGFELGAQLQAVPGDLEVLIPARRASMAPLLEAVRPDLAVCTGFPWKVPRDALAVPTLGWINGHPSFLPRHRGPVPVAWAIRNGEPEIGLTFHRMDAELDTGAILAQRSITIGEYTDPDEFYPRTGPPHLDAFVEALGKLAAGDEGTAQGQGGEYETFFTDADADLDLARPAVEVHRMVWAWRYAMAAPGSRRGALLELDGEAVRVLESSLTEVADAPSVACADAPLWLVRTEPA